MRLRQCIFRRRIWQIPLYVFIFLGLWLTYQGVIKNDTSDSKVIFDSCPIPDFTEYSSYSNYVSIGEIFKCLKNKISFVTISNGIVLVKSSSTCQYQCIQRHDDFESIVQDKFELKNGTKLPCPYFISTCSKENTEEEYVDVMVGIDRNSNLLQRAYCKAAFENIYDILILGVSSLSYNAWKAMLPETFNTFHNNLQGISFTKFNTLGDGPTANLQALLTGTKDTEVYESRRRIMINNYVDDYNWIWRHLKRKGYITSFVDEMTRFGTFQYRLRGFRNEPTDFYMRTLLLAVEKLKLIEDFCLPSTSLHKMIFDFQSQLDDMYFEVPKFSFIYFTRYSKADSLRYLDAELSRFIMEVKQKNPNLFLILYSDDGKFNERKSSMVDKYEERLPFMGISLPNRMEEKRAVLERNSRILTSSFDLHATLEDLIGIYKPLNGTRHMSLLRPLPSNRACKDIDVSSHWCSCFNWKEISVPSTNRDITRLSLELVKIISSKTKYLRHLCEPLKLDRILEAHTISPTSDVLRFKKSSDPDGFIPELSDNTVEDIFWYRVTVITQPGGATFTASFSAIFQNFNISINKLFSKDIVRLNKDPKLIKCLRTGLKNKRIFLHEIDSLCICKEVNLFLNKMQ